MGTVALLATAADLVDAVEHRGVEGDVGGGDLAVELLDMRGPMIAEVTAGG